MIATPICGTCDCNAIAIFCFLLGLTGGTVLSVIMAEGDRRKALKEKEKDGDKGGDDL